MTDYDLASDLEGFKKQTKTVDSKNDIRFKKLFKAIRHNPEISVFRSILNYLKENLYQSKVEDLNKLFATE